MRSSRPLLTGSAPILGMVPIAPTIFWGPMAYAIMGGLAVATVLTLVFLPALYVTWFRIKRPQPGSIQKIRTSADRHSSAADLRRGSELTVQPPAGATKTKVDQAVAPREKGASDETS